MAKKGWMVSDRGETDRYELLYEFSSNQLAGLDVVPM
jgi:hypothetical protein